LDHISKMGDLAYTALKACTAKPKDSDKQYVLKAEEKLKNALKLSKPQWIENAKTNLAKA